MCSHLLKMKLLYITILSLIGLDVTMTSNVTTNVTVINGTLYEMIEADKAEVKVDKEYEVNSTDIELDEESFLTHGVEVNYMFFNISVKMSNRSERVTAMCLLPKDIEDPKPFSLSTFSQRMSLCRCLCCYPSCFCWITLVLHSKTCKKDWKQYSCNDICNLSSKGSCVSRFVCLITS